MAPSQTQQKAGCWVVFAALVALVFVFREFLPGKEIFERLLAGSAPERSEDTGAPEPDPQAAILDEQKKLLAEQSAAVKAELRGLYDERIKLRKERIEGLAERLTSEKSREYDKILLKNSCGFEVAVALYYRDLDETWITRGWWTIKPEETVTTDAMTKNAYIYFYAENKAEGRTWDGKGKPTALSLNIVDEKFDALEGDRFVYENPRSVSFYQRKTGDQWGDHTETFECFLEEPPAGQ